MDRSGNPAENYLKVIFEELERIALLKNAIRVITTYCWYDALSIILSIAKIRVFSDSRIFLRKIALGNAPISEILLRAKFLLRDLCFFVMFMYGILCPFCLR
jgi:tRNA nucleotidyltransferase/poly(A) polymerase